MDYWFFFNLCGDWRDIMAIHIRRFALAAVVCVLMPGSDSLAQHHPGHFHSPGFGGVSNNFGGVRHGAGAFRTTGSATYGVGLVQQSGGFNNSVGFNSRYPIGNRSLGGSFSSPAYTYGTFSAPYYGVARGGYGYGYGFGGPNYYSSGYLQPVIVSTPIFNYSPSVFGNGTGVFSPNFPSGTYVTNAYMGGGPFGGYGSYCQTGWPYVTGLNPYSPGAIIAPSMLNLNMNLNVQPFFPSTASYTITDPRIIDQLAPPPEPGGVVFPPFPAFQEDVGGPAIPDAPPLPMAQDGVPVLNEFDAVPVEKKASTLAEKIQSLRYQSGGDDAFRKSDYATADVFYATAVKTASDRRAPYLRMAIVRISLHDFPQAVRYLKAGLAMKSDASRPWITAEELYGSKVAERARSHGGPLWNWLAERPLSADRLLLAGTFQKVRGFDKTADQMLDLARHEGPEAMLVSQVEQLARNDIGPRSVSHDLNQMIDDESTRRTSLVTPELQSAQEQSIEQAGGIFLRGDDETSQTDRAVKSALPRTVPPIPVLTPPEPNLETAPVPIEIPVPE